jgi:hypothetical protein
VRAAAHNRAHVLRPCARMCACVCDRARTHPRRHMRARSVGVDRGWLGSQAFSSATVFSANIGGWNVLRVTTYTSGFDSVGLADCIKRGVYDNWGSTLRTAYPTWSSLSAVCATPTPTATPRYPILLGPSRHGRATAALGCSGE